MKSVRWPVVDDLNVCTAEPNPIGRATAGRCGCQPLNRRPVAPREPDNFMVDGPIQNAAGEIVRTPPHGDVVSPGVPVTCPLFQLIGLSVSRMPATAQLRPP